MNLNSLVGKNVTAFIDNDFISFMVDGEEVLELHPHDVMEQALLLLGFNIEYA